MSNTGPDKKARRKVHWIASRRNLETARNFNRQFEIGTKVRYMGMMTETETKAAQDVYGEACVFLKDFEEPALLVALEIPGFKVQTQRGRPQQSEPHA